METHHSYAIQCIEAGKHVLVEKPTAVTIAEIEEIKEAANRKGVHVAPVHNYIYEPTVMRAKDLIESGKLGEIVSIYAFTTSTTPKRSPPGTRGNSANSHAPCILHALLRGSSPNGILHESYDKRRQRTQENLAMVTLQMQNNLPRTCRASFASDDHAGDPWTFMIKVIGTKGATRYSYRDWVENTPAVVHSQTYSAYPYTIRSMGRHFLEEVIGKGEEPLSSLDDAITCMKIIEACEQSVELNKGTYLSEVRSKR